MLDILKDPRVQNILFAPSGFAYPDAPDKPVAIRIGLRTGFQGPVQQQFHKQVVAQLGALGFSESLGYDTREYTLVRGSMPYKNLDRLVKDVRFEPSGWFLAETPLSKLPAPLREGNPLRWTEVLPITEFPRRTSRRRSCRRSSSTRPTSAPALGTADKNAPLRVEVVFQNRLDDLESLRSLIQGRYAGASARRRDRKRGERPAPRRVPAWKRSPPSRASSTCAPAQGAETIAVGGNGVLLQQALKDSHLNELHRAVTPARG